MEGLKLYARLLWRPPRETLLFALRTVAAGLLTLYLAFLFDLEQPKWALMTVVIVSQPLAGMALKRSFAQVVGTFAGAVVAVLIMALFAQQPLPFFVALGLWLALCTAGGTLLRYTDSHAFVLSGFTAVIVAVLSIPDPENTFMLAVVRVTETLLGVACVALVSLLSARPQAVAKGYFAQVDGLIRSTARHAAAVIRGDEGDESFNQRQMQLVASITALDGLRRHLYFDAPNLRRADGLVQLLGNLLVLMASRLLLLRQHRLLVRAHWVGPLPADIQALLDRALRVLDALAEQGRAVPSEVLEEFQAVRQAFDAAATRAESYDEALSPALRPQVAILRWEYARLFQRLGEVLELNDAIQSGRQASSFYRRGQAQALHLDWALASMNAVRAFVALSCAAWLWITSAWNGALSSLLLVGVMCSLMATFPRPLLAAQNFLRGAAAGDPDLGGAAVRAVAGIRRLRVAGAVDGVAAVRGRGRPEQPAERRDRHGHRPGDPADGGAAEYRGLLQQRFAVVRVRRRLPRRGGPRRAGVRPGLSVPRRPAPAPAALPVAPGRRGNVTLRGQRGAALRLRDADDRSPGGDGRPAAGEPGAGCGGTFPVRPGLRGDGRGVEPPARAAA